MKIIDNILPADDFRLLQNEILSNSVPWYFGRKANSSSQPENPFLYGWFSNVYYGGNWMLGEVGELIYTHALQALRTAGETVSELKRARLVLNTAADENYKFGTHCDLSYPHKTAILYINNADGNTFIYNETYDFNPTTDSVEFLKETIKDLTVMKEIEPVENRLVCFDGAHYHSGNTPTTVPRRVVLNINYISA